MKAIALQVCPSKKNHWINKEKLISNFTILLY